MPRFQLLIAAIEFAATLAFALSGFIEAARRRMDVVGVFAVAFITAFGGGTVRDVLLDRRPFFWVEHQAHVWLIFLLSLVAVPWLRARHHQFTERAILVPDALGLGLFTVTGVSLAWDAGMPVFVSAMMGVITGVFGTTSPHGENNARGLITYGTMKNLTKGVETAPVPEPGTPAAPIATKAAPAH